MAALDASGRQRDALPSISNLDFDKYRIDKADHSRYSLMPNPNMHHNNIGSPPTTYSGPPPPYSSAASIPNTMSGYVSPPESTSRRSTRDDKESPMGSTFLPSISEALKSADVPPSAQSHNIHPAPGQSALSSFADAPRGPGNPFMQPGAPASALRSSLSLSTAGPEPSPIKAVPPPPPSAALADTRQAPMMKVLGSPRSSLSNHRLSGPLPSSVPPVDSPYRSSYSTEPPRPGYPFPDPNTSRTSATPLASTSFTFEHHGKSEELRNPFAKTEHVPYGETVKRHLDVFDAGLALNEITEASARMLEFSKSWSQRYHQSNHTNYYTDDLPGTDDIDESVRHAQHVIDNLARLREVAVMQQTALDEQRARAAHGQHAADEYHRLPEDFKAGGFAGGDAKKRRGKAAPPGRCHSCNRAETPEWRRGPDGARTLCNACGLHYAKLTRKMGANKAAVLTGSNLRPKG